MNWTCFTLPTSTLKQISTQVWRKVWIENETQGQGGEKEQTMIKVEWPFNLLGFIKIVLVHDYK
jgi:hypothetical protein